VPDIYQGNELWDFSLVDPDNRRPVDYGLRRKLLAEMKGMDPGDARSLLEDGAWQSGAPKMYLTWKVLELRNEKAELFERGEYAPLTVEGEMADHIVAFARVLGEEAVVVLAPRLFSKPAADGGALIPDPHTWANTCVSLPEELSGKVFRDVFTGEDVGGDVVLESLFEGFPVALLDASV
ncbi:MAG: malto-oligosyltrehalose synthase, partial [Rubrobacteraceae bacterium]